MNSKILIRWICVMLLMTSAGCKIFPPGPPEVPPTEPNSSTSSFKSVALSKSLTATQIQAVLKCQSGIKEEGAEFTHSEEKNLGGCLDEVLALQIPFESGQIGTTDYNTQLDAIRRDCAERFDEIGEASTSLVDRIIEVCGPVQSLILPVSGYDPLGFGTLSRVLRMPLVGDASRLAGEICGAKALFVDLEEAVQVPRFVPLLETLDNGTGKFAIPGPPSSALTITPTIPNLPLDSRCSYPSLP